MPHFTDAIHSFKCTKIIQIVKLGLALNDFQFSVKRHTNFYLIMMFFKLKTWFLFTRPKSSIDSSGDMMGVQDTILRHPLQA